MGKLIEYLKALKQAVKNPDLVLEGWINDAKLQNSELTEDEMDEIIRRRAICHECPFMSINAIAAGNYITQRTDEHCMHCFCPITKKTASLSSNCGIEVYNVRNKNNKMPLKWEAYQKPQTDDNTTTN